jgi:hypothetical protein
MVLRVRIPYLLPIMDKEKWRGICARFQVKYGHVVTMVGTTGREIVAYVETEEDVEKLPALFEGITVIPDVAGVFAPAFDY